MPDSSNNTPLTSQTGNPVEFEGITQADINSLASAARSLDSAERKEEARSQTENPRTAKEQTDRFLSLRLAESEQAYLELQSRVIEIRTKEAELKGRIQDIRQRRHFAIGIFCLILLWLIGIFAVIILHGFLNEKVLITGVVSSRKWTLQPQFKLSEPVLLALIGGTTVNVIGLLILVVQYLFPKKNGDMPAASK